MYIYILAVVTAAVIGLALMAKRRKFRRYLKGRIDFELAIGALAGNTTISGAETNVLDETAWLSSVKATYAMNDFALLAGRGPMWVGLAHSDYTTAEIEEWIEEGASWTTGDKIATREINRRLIRQIGVFANSGVASNVDALNDGRPIRTKCGWSLSTGQTVRFWAYNSGSVTLSSGALLHVNGHANLWPN